MVPTATLAGGRFGLPMVPAIKPLGDGVNERRLLPCIPARFGAVCAVTQSDPTAASIACTVDGGDVQGALILDAVITPDRRIVRDARGEVRLPAAVDGVDTDAAERRGPFTAAVAA